VCQKRGCKPFWSVKDENIKLMSRLRATGCTNDACDQGKLCNVKKAKFDLHKFVIQFKPVTVTANQKAGRQNNTICEETVCN
jgi:hypothetical protein